jgi:hypothetical protein
VGLGGHLLEPSAEQPSQGGWDLEGLTGREGRACWQDAGELQRVERIAAADLLQALQGWPGQSQPQPLTQLVQDADGQGTHPQDHPL